MEAQQALEAMLLAGTFDLDPTANPSWMKNEHSNRRLREIALGTSSMYLNNADRPPLGPPPGFQPINQQQQQYAAAAPEAPFEVESSCCILCCY